ncbi:MAG: polysaccharide lyase family 7 protein, partial [Marinirhabdus sp.]
MVLLANAAIAQNSTDDNNLRKPKKEKKKKYKLPNIDLAHWSVTIPEGENGRAKTVQPPGILNYAGNELLKKYMYNDSVKGALVFYSFPSNATTANTKYARSELREQIVPGDNNTNWTFADGGRLRATIQMDKVSRDTKGKYHKVILLQIHGRLTNQQKETIGQKDNDAPPILKIYWDKGKIRLKTKKLLNPATVGNGLLYKEAWVDDTGFNFDQEVGFKQFKVEIKVTKGKMLISLNNNEFKSYEGPSISKWGVFENYFKAGNYFQSRDKGSFAKVK